MVTGTITSKPSVADCPTDPPIPTAEIRSNGFVYPNPTYSYIGHKYNYDINPGDNDMPALRQYAIDHGIFDGIDMNLDWKEREWEMMKAIIWHTSHLFTWTGVNTINHYARALMTLNDAQTNPDHTFSCGAIAASALGLAQAHGIPSRFVASITETFGSDSCFEMYSTSLNRWVFFFPHSYGWIEHEIEGPMGLRELRPLDMNGTLQVLRINAVWTGIEVPPIRFKPTTNSHAPIPPHAASKWWKNYFFHFMVARKNLANDIYPGSFSYVHCDNWINEYEGTNAPVVPIDDLNITYPLNNVQASVSLAGSAVHLTLVHNMFEFNSYQMRVDDGPWEPFTLSPVEGMPQTYEWSPLQAPSTLSIRGVNIAGVHSPDVVIDFTLVDPPPLPNGDYTNDGSVNASDLELFSTLVLNGGATEIHLCRGDFDDDQVISLSDAPAFVDELISP